ncbi:signal peptidase I [Sphaerisporangium album]|uniref:signal peptidase I n=1 Tax=Sphaerisporangium album TaxID=509200 RepID=UPI0015F0FE99|nr:signal peptidase I [Sphaerisporangium album]
MTRARTLALVLLTAALTAGCGLAYSIRGQRAFDVRSESMAPTIQPGTRVVADLVDHYTPRTGDIVVIQPPEKWGANGPVLTRVIGIPGSTLKCCDANGKVLLDDKPLLEPYTGLNGNADRYFDAVTVPSGRVWVMGDNRELALDSRSYRRMLGDGTVPVENVIGVVHSE